MQLSRPERMQVTVSVVLVLLACHQLLAVDAHDVHEKQGAMKKRLSLQSTGEFLSQNNNSAQVLVSLQDTNRGIQF